MVSSEKTILLALYQSRTMGVWPEQGDEVNDLVASVSFSPLDYGQCRPRNEVNDLMACSVSQITRVQILDLL